MRIHSSKLVVIFWLSLMHYGCIQKTDIKQFEHGEHKLNWYKFEGGDVSNFGGWVVQYKIDCGLLSDDAPIYFIEPASFNYYDSLSVDFFGNDTVVIVPVKDGVPIEKFSCTINLSGIDCQTRNICKFRLGKKQTLNQAKK